MKYLKYIAFILSIITFVIAMIARLFMPDKVLMGLAALTYLRLTVTMLLFSIACHFLFTK